eukprot:Rhum_TRINITY_DN13591_c0_g1::Rhum_TRINITY_DN13591_c0_g1_i1::g.61571::m.61571
MTSLALAATTADPPPSSLRATPSLASQHLGSHQAATEGVAVTAFASVGLLSTLTQHTHAHAHTKATFVYEFVHGRTTGWRLGGGGKAGSQVAAVPPHQHPRPLSLPSGTSRHPHPHPCSPLPSPPPLPSVTSCLSFPPPPSLSLSLSSLPLLLQIQRLPSSHFYSIFFCCRPPSCTTHSLSPSSSAPSSFPSFVFPFLRPPPPPHNASLCLLPEKSFPCVAVWRAEVGVGLARRGYDGCRRGQTRKEGEGGEGSSAVKVLHKKKQRKKAKGRRLVWSGRAQRVRGGRRNEGGRRVTGRTVEGGE